MNYISFECTLQLVNILQYIEEIITKKMEISFNSKTFPIPRVFLYRTSKQHNMSTKNCTVFL